MDETAPDRLETIGIIGAGHIGQAFARVARRVRHDVVIANSRGPAAPLGAGVSPGTIGEAATSPGGPRRGLPDMPDGDV